MVSHSDLMQHAIAAAKDGIRRGESPFGAAIAGVTGEVLLTAHNTVREDCDATAHAEVNAIRGACRKLDTIDLRGHIIAATCEPCPMCAAAIHWAGLDAVVFGAAIADARAAGFNELEVSLQLLYESGMSRVRVYPAVLADECKTLFALWRQGSNPDPY